MKHVAILSLLLFASCFGSRAREHALEPAIRQAWEGVGSDVRRGISDAETDGDVSAPDLATITALERELALAIEAEDERAVADVPFPILVPFAERGIQDRVDDEEISSGVAQSLLERLRQFEEALLALRRRIARALFLPNPRMSERQVAA